MTRSRGKVSAEAQEIMSGKSMKKATGKKTTTKTKKRSPNEGRPGKRMLTTKGTKTMMRHRTSNIKKMYRKPGHWKDPDPYRFFQEMIRQYYRGCREVAEEMKIIKKKEAAKKRKNLSK